MNTLLPAVIMVRWTKSKPIPVMEGDGMWELIGEAVGAYAYPIEIGVRCAEPLVADVEAGMDIFSNTSMLVSVNATRSLLHQVALCIYI